MEVIKIRKNNIDRPQIVVLIGIFTMIILAQVIPNVQGIVLGIYLVVMVFITILVMKLAIYLLAKDKD